jgi:GNAT superfamily N-acetyltransferase
MWVRDATIEDVGAILEFVRAKAQFDRDLGAFSGELETNEELIRRHVFGPKPFASVLLSGEAAAAKGFAFYYFCYSSFRGRPNVWLDDLYVYPSERRNGIGRVLMLRLAQIARGADCTNIAWLASASNSIGMSFYRKLGAVGVQQNGDAVTLRIEPATLIESIGGDGRC